MAQRSAPVEESAIEDLNIVIFSDHHRGNGDGADDFRKCRNIYHAALGYYDSLASRLFLLGDVEELWERLLLTVIDTYEGTLELEKRFFDRGAGVRFFGNHDDSLKWPWNLSQIEKYIGDFPLHEALRIKVHQDGEALGELFFAHGHQGILYTGLHRFIVKRFWAPIQRLTGIGVGIPSSDHRLRYAHEQAMYDWTNAQPDPLLMICGHTHHPVFMSTALEETVRNELQSLVESGASEEVLAMKQAELQWVLADQEETVSAMPQNARPTYFNTGCCSFADGTITGIEISHGQIRLVRWSSARGKPERIILRAADLASVLRQCARTE